MATEKLSILISAKDEATKQINSVGESLSGMSTTAKVMGGAMIAAGAAAVAFGISAVKAAAEAEVQIAKVDATLATMTGDFKENRKKVLEAADAVTQYGFDNEAAAVNIANLFQRTNDMNKAIELNSLAMDIARAKNVDLATAGNMVGMVLSGNARALKQFGIELDEAKGPMAALEELQGKVTGQAEAFTQTFQGQMSVLSEQWGEFKEGVGAAMIGVLTAVLGKINELASVAIPWINEQLQEFSKWLNENQTLVQFLTDLLGIGLKAAIWVVKTAFEAVAFIINGVSIGIKNIIADINAFIERAKAFYESAKSIASSAVGLTDKIGAAFDLKQYLPGRAEGGSVTQNKPYVVGENGPEVFVPGKNGSIIPNGGMGGINITINGDVSGEEVAEKIGNLIIRRLKFHTATVGI